MNKALFDKVKDLCKDYGLSEKYLQATTEAMGGHVADDSTDTEEIEKVANQVASVAKASQAEATRWAAKKETKTEQKKKKSEDEDEDEDDTKKSKKHKSEEEDDPYEARIKALEEKLAKAEEEKSKTSRKAVIEKAMEDHKIPQYLRSRFAKSIDDEEDVEEAVKAYKQELITNGLDKDESNGAKAASDKDIDDASENLLKSISTNQENK